MRYFTFNFPVDLDSLKTIIKDKRFENYYDGPVAVINHYLYKNMINDNSFFIYRVEGGIASAVFSYDERKVSYDTVFDYLAKTLRNDFEIKNIKDNCVEITIYDCISYYNEAKRHDYTVRGYAIRDYAKLWLYDYVNVDTKWNDLNFDFDEKIISVDKAGLHKIYSQSLNDEIRAIEEHADSKELTGNVFHYIISARSMKATEDIAGRLMSSLYRAGRLSSRRMEIIKSIGPEVYKKCSNHIVDVIENNFGGVVVFDLSERAGRDKTEYGETCRYLENLVKKYRNDCTFVFTYNINHPGFSYTLLPELKNYILPVMIREGSGNRQVAISYLKKLISES